MNLGLKLLCINCEQEEQASLSSLSVLIQGLENSAPAQVKAVDEDRAVIEQAEIIPMIDSETTRQERLKNR